MAIAPSGPLARALDRIGDRWTLLLVDALLDGPRRYGELAEAIAGIAPNVLAARLRKLEADGLVVATPYQERPRRLQYELSAEGRSLAGALEVLARWAARHDGARDPQYHATCGTAVELRPWCPTCDRVVEPGEADDLDRL